MTPDAPRMSDDEFRQLVQRTLAEHDTRAAEHAERMAAHEARMAAHEATMVRMDRQYDKLVEIQLEHASRQDEHERIMDMMRVTLEAIKDLLRERRN